MRFALWCLPLLITGCGLLHSVNLSDGPVNVPSLKFNGVYSSSGVWVEFDGVTYAAVPSHVAIEGYDGTAFIEFQGRNFPIKSIFTSKNRDLTLLAIENPPPAQVVARQNSAQNIPFAIEKPLKELTFLQSGSLHRVNGRMTFLVGMILGKNKPSKSFYVILDAIDQAELQEVNLGLLAAEAEILRSWRHRNVLVGAEDDQEKRKELFLRSLAGEAVELSSCFYISRRFAEEQQENAKNAHELFPELLK